MSVQKRKLKLPGRYAEEEWFLVRFTDDDEVSEPVQGHDLEDAMTGESGDEKKFNVGNLVNAPWYGGRLYEGKVIYESDNKEECRREYIRLTTKKTSTGNKNRKNKGDNKNDKKSEKTGEKSPGSKIKQADKEYDPDIAKKKKETNAEKKLKASFIQKTNIEEANEIFKLHIGLKDAGQAEGSRQQNGQTLTERSSTAPDRSPQILVQRTTLTQDADQANGFRPQNGLTLTERSSTAPGPDNLVQRTTLTNTQDAGQVEGSRQQNGQTLTERSSTAPGRSPQILVQKTTLTQDADQANGFRLQNGLTLTELSPIAPGLKWKNNLVERTTLTQDAGQAEGFRHQKLQNGQTLTERSSTPVIKLNNCQENLVQETAVQDCSAKGTFTNLLNQCADCVIKESRMNQLRDYASQLERDRDGWRAEAIRTQTQLDEILTRQSADTSLHNRTGVEGYYTPKRGIQIPKCYFITQQEQGYVPLVEDCNIFVPTKWLAELQGYFKNKTKSHCLKLLMNGFYEPGDLINQTALTVFQTELGKALKAYAIKKLLMDATSVVKGINSKIGTSNRTFKSLKGSKCSISAN